VAKNLGFRLAHCGLIVPAVTAHGVQHAGVRVAELVATMSYAADLGLGQPMEHCMRHTAISLRLADLIGTTPEERAAIYYMGMLINAYCHADATEQAEWFGDDIAFKSEGVDVLGMNTVHMLATLIRRVGSHGPPLDRAKRLATFPAVVPKKFVSFVTTHSTLGSQFAAKAGFDELVVTAIAQSYEQWDGKGEPRHLKGDEICLPARIVPFAAQVEMYAQRNGKPATVAMVKKQRGKSFDPAIADLFVAHVDEVIDGLDDAGSWDALLAVEPGPARRVDGSDLDAALEAIADLVDLKSVYHGGHSRGVANLAAAAARQAGLSAVEQTVLRRAGLIHDLGRMGVSTSVWDKPGRLTDAELERVQLHPYLTDRMLAKVPNLGRVREIAARHHERLDGSGYPRGLRAESLTWNDRILAAADVYHALTEPRPHRPPFTGDDAATQLRAQVRAGLLDGDAVGAVLRAAGHRAPARREWPSGLTAREVEVLQLLARGQANKQIAARLAVTPKTVSNHVEHIYDKIGVSSRAAATLYATQHGLMGNYEPDPR
jgi:HD-GYP domain-containing protein (c-di-GMP phosphodiesterase class II)